MTNNPKGNIDSSNAEITPQLLKWTPDLVRKFWDGLTHTKLLGLGFSKQVGKSLIVAIEHIFTANAEILDFGAGDGDLVKLLCERGYSTAAYENSKERQHALNRELNNYSNYLGIIDKNSNKTFDVIIMAEVIEHILDEEFHETLNHVTNLLEPGGVLIVTTPNNEDLDMNMVYCPVSNMLFHKWQHVRAFTDQSLKELLQKYGVEEIATHRIELNDLVFLPGDKMWGQDKNGTPPSFLTEIRQNQSVNAGGEQNLLYLGRKVG